MYKLVFNILKFNTKYLEMMFYLIIQYLKLLSLCTITVLPLTAVYIVSEVHCTLNVLHSITP